GSGSGMFIDIGGGKTEIASVGREGIVAGATVNIAGNAFTNAIIDMVAEKYYIKIGDITAEKLKCESLSFYRNDAGVDFVSGAGMSDGMPKNAEIMAQDLFEAVAPLVDDLVDVMMSVLASTPPEIASEIYRNGFYITGGSSQIAGLNQYLADRMGLYSTMMDDVENGVVLGGGKFLDSMNDFGTLIGVDLNN
ncbi:MAG: rod shape-determining protein, partial [Christensenellales bacterium]